MRHLFYKLALSTALVTGAAVAQADCYSKTVSTDNTAGFQLAQAGGGSSGGSGGSTGSTGSTTGNSSGTSGTGAGSGTTSPNSTSGGAAPDTIIPQDRQMRSPSVPGTPPQPGTGQTNR